MDDDARKAEEALARLRTKLQEGSFEHGANCPCGEELPWHMLNKPSAGKEFGHRCACGRTYWRKGDSLMEGEHADSFDEFAVMDPPGGADGACETCGGTKLTFGETSGTKRRGPGVVSCPDCT